MSLFVCAKCGCVDNTATSSYWMLTNEYMVDKFDYAKELQPYKGMGLCSECGRLTTAPDGRDVVVPGKWHGKFPKEKATEEQLKKDGKRLWLYSASRVLTVMMHGDREDNPIPEMLPNAGTNPDNIITTISGIGNDGGDW